jgi:hypothetical protein
MRIPLILALVCLPVTALADERCFELSRDGKTWSKTPERLCVAPDPHPKNAGRHVLTLATGIAGAEAELATFRFDLTKRVKCLDCNKDEFGVANPENSIGNQLRIVFNGKRDPKTMAERGRLTIGKTRFHYRSYPPAAAPPAKPAP